MSVAGGVSKVAAEDGVVTHQPWCLSLDNVLGRHDCDCHPDDILMRAQVARELLDYPPRREWITDRDPPRSGSYLVRVENDVAKWVRIERWDGAGWPLTGGYATVTGWMEMPGV